ncbi:MAG: hypothetical protein CO023_00260 [Flavobacteriales bacterium CG_4_9_14_0_2_um_filter_35_242]|nr:hypothetical protein [Flavobacteriales bacterium]PIR13896.1 MAG: hypothetical protein COV50_05080 [Flavobacteriales bacterium CG11_big_fil_rev_8_21_14_0_20_35_7]PIV16538.1 MAG: hypothetical protein COS42_09460 [Flavobacteriales bacterium CG03_land_8_20_14_0_80_35_15]PJA05691.1 MAG: hypothetical protein COX71_05415 [Flavobacteriales bacterium CG_4_10_14_0_2_um_filter_35_18]PJC60775.1 MAG: hypothetical protein CO023_00260 [Flavobacteriales bacterium CG_4_9_14_0_2_um_filter_35_242]
MIKNKILKSNIFYSMVWRGINTLFMYLTVPFLLNYLGNQYYGVWVTIYGLLITAYFMDIGITLGLKNKLAVALSNKNYILAKTLISTAYISISIISLFLIIVGFLFVYSFKMNQIFNINIAEHSMKLIVLVNIVLVVFSVTLNIYKSIYLAFQKASKIEFAMATYQGFVFLQIVLLPLFIENSLLMVSLIYGITNLLIGFVFTVIFFNSNKSIRPSFNSFKINQVKELMGLSLNFFVIQLSLIVILTTDNLIITNLINPESTTVYSIVYKVFQPFLIASTLIFTPLWTLFTDAYNNKDFEWIKKTLRRLNLLFMALILGVILVSFNFNRIINFWIHKELNYSNSLILFMAIFVLIRIYGDIYMTFLNGISQIKLQMWLYVFGAIINIPLSIIFIKYYHLGSSGVILATCISLFGLAIAMPIQSLKILKSTDVFKKSNVVT